MTLKTDIKNKLLMSSTMPAGTAGSMPLTGTVGHNHAHSHTHTHKDDHGHVHGPGCGCGMPLADDGDEFEDEE